MNIHAVKIIRSTKAEEARHYQNKFVEKFVFANLEQLLEH